MLKKTKLFVLSILLMSFAALNAQVTTSSMSGLVTDAEGAIVGAAVVATGRSDFPNQVNNCLGFPGIFRGALDVRARRINEEMKLAASLALAELVSGEELSKNYIIPSALDPRVVPAVAKAVANAALITGVARINLNGSDNCVCGI